MRKVLKILFAVIAIGFVLYNRIPRYHELTRGVEEIGVSELSYVEIESKASSAVKVVISERHGKGYDAYLLSEAEMAKIKAWLDTDDSSQPNVNFLAKWENRGAVEQEGIVIPGGTYYLLLDNTILGGDYNPDSSIKIDFVLSEKY